MPNGTAPTNHILAWATGELIGSAGLNEQNEAILDVAGQMLSDGLLGVPSFNGTGSPLTVVPGPVANQAIVGGPGQECVIGYRVCNEMPATILYFQGNSSGGPRTDYIVATPTETQGYEFTTPFRNPDRSVNPAGAAYKQIQSAVFSIIKGPNANTKVPAGSYPIAAVVIPNGRAAIFAGNITMLLPTFSSTVNAMVAAQIANAIAAIPSYGAPGITSDNGTITAEFDGTNYHVENPGITNLNGLVGPVVISSPNNSLTVDFSGTSIVIENPGILSLNGEVGAMSITSIDGSLSVTAGIGAVDMSNNGVTSLAGQIQDITLNSPDNSILFNVGNNVIELFNGGVKAIGVLVGDVNLGSPAGTINFATNNSTNTLLFDVAGIETLQGQKGNVVLESLQGTMQFGTSGSSAVTAEASSILDTSGTTHVGFHLVGGYNTDSTGKITVVIPAGRRVLTGSAISYNNGSGGAYLVSALFILGAIGGVQFQATVPSTGAAAPSGIGIYFDLVIV